MIVTRRERVEEEGRGREKRKRVEEEDTERGLSKETEDNGRAELSVAALQRSQRNIHTTMIHCHQICDYIYTHSKQPKLVQISKF